MAEAVTVLPALLGLTGVRARVQEPLAAHGALRAGGPAELWVEVDDERALLAALTVFRDAKVLWRVVPPLAEWVVRGGGLRGACIRLGAGFEGVTLTEDAVVVGSASPWTAVGSVVDRVPALERLTRWPGFVGALAHDNSPLLSKGFVRAVRWAHGGRIQEHEVGTKWAEVPPAAVVVALVLQRDRTPPKDRPPPTGTLFRDIDSRTTATDCIARAGLGGTRLRAWRLAESEPGTVVNLGGGTVGDLALLIQGAKARVDRERGLQLDTRVAILGDREEGGTS